MPGLARPSGRSSFMWSASHRATDAFPRTEGSSPASSSAEGRWLAVSHRRQHPRPPVHGRGAQPKVDSRLHLHLDRGRMAVRRRCHRSALAAARQLVNERHHDRPARHRRTHYGDLAAREAGRPAAPPDKGSNIRARSSSGRGPTMGRRAR